MSNDETKQDKPAGVSGEQRVSESTVFARVRGSPGFDFPAVYVGSRKDWTGVEDETVVDLSVRESGEAGDRDPWSFELALGGEDARRVANAMLDVVEADDE